MAKGAKMFSCLEEVRRASRQELVAYLENWGTACYDDEPTSLLREAAVETFETESLSWQRWFYQVNKKKLSPRGGGTPHPRYPGIYVPLWAAFEACAKSSFNIRGKIFSLKPFNNANYNTHIRDTYEAKH